MQKIIITGAKSFIGRHLLTAFEQNHVAIKILTRQANTNFLDSPSITNHLGDLLDETSLEGLIEPNSTVIHLAYLGQGSPEQNMRAIKHLANQCIKHKIKRLIHCSSVSIYGNINDKIIDENSACNPESDYAKTKLLIEKYLLSKASNQFEIAILRPTQVFGAQGKNLLKLVNDLKQNSRVKNYLKSCLMAKRTMNLVSVKNVVEALLFLTKAQDLSEKFYIISDDENQKNYYRYVEACLMRQLGLKNYAIPVIPLPLFIYRHLYKFFKKETINPKKRYIGNNLKKMGFIKNSRFEEALVDFGHVVNYENT